MCTQYILLVSLIPPSHLHPDTSNLMSSLCLLFPPSFPISPPPPFHLLFFSFIIIIIITETESHVSPAGLDLTM